MNKDLEKMWEKTSQTGEKMLLGDIVVCDYCSEDYTESDEHGGFLFGSYATCPKCAAKMRPDIERYGEENHIRARCPEGKSFADFIREIRGPDAAIQIHGGDILNR